MFFTKMHGAGNDYVFVDCFTQPAPEDPHAVARKVSQRRYGIGSDGLILICPSDEADAEMQMYNADGSYSSMCGNGIRCVGKYLYDRRSVRRQSLTVASGKRIYELQLNVSGESVAEVCVDMGAPVLVAEQIPTLLPGNPPLDIPLGLPQGVVNVTCVSMGNPHSVVFVDEATDELVETLGPAIENDGRFPERTNVVFVEVRDRRRLAQRTWERGSGETLACGTGSCAACVAAVLTGRADRDIVVELRGGELHIAWRESDDHVLMTGPAVEVFTGNWKA